MIAHWQRWSRRITGPNVSILQLTPTAAVRRSGGSGPARARFTARRGWADEGGGIAEHTRLACQVGIVLVKHGGAAVT
jgi:hypothetical protein